MDDQERQDEKVIRKPDKFMIGSRNQYKRALWLSIGSGSCLLAAFACSLLGNATNRMGYLAAILMLPPSIWLFIYLPVIRLKALRAMYLKYEAGEHFEEAESAISESA
ncbi:MAG: hypothetical protein JW941_09605 [Candidatus Coatesbacteria bacterium]|nr:hypothetical protein [Candidatus Coatesbacteria bacterium]